MNRSNALKPPKTAALPQASMELDEDSLGRYLGVSIALHLILLAALTLKAVFYPSESLQLERAIRVDIVGLPEKQAKLPPALKEEIKNEAKPEPKTEPKAEPVTPPKPEKVVLPDKTQPPPKPETNKINLQKTKQQQDSALKRLEALRKLEEEASKTKATTVAASQPAPVRGNVLSAGSSLTGLAKLENDSYLTDLDEHVKQHWHLPNFLANAGFSATVALFIDERGAVIKKELVKSSGNPIYDQTVLAAIEKSAPFPAPPAKLVNIFAVDGVRLGFPD